MTEAIKYKYLNRLQKDAHKLTLSFVLGQLIVAGFSIDQIHFVSEDNDYSHAHLIKFLKVGEGQAIIGVNLGWLSSQAFVKKLKHFDQLVESESFTRLSDAWLKYVILMMHPELNRLYQQSFISGTTVHALNPAAISQINRQLRDVFPEYDIGVEVKGDGRENLESTMVLGEVKLSDFSILEKTMQSNSEICITFYHDEYLEPKQVAHLISILKSQWLSEYGKYWQGFSIKLYQELAGDCALTHLPSSLSGESVLMASRQLMGEMSAF